MIMSTRNLLALGYGLLLMENSMSIQDRDSSFIAPLAHFNQLQYFTLESHLFSSDHCYFKGQVSAVTLRSGVQ